MKVFIVYCHPSKNSFTREVRDSFIAGLESAGHSHILSDLYEMDFISDISEEEYRREAYYSKKLPIPLDVAFEHEKINFSDAIAFIYPIFWSDAPAKLVGWFNRVWTYGYAYGDNRTMKQLEKGLVICTAGNTLKYFEETGLGDAMEKVMLLDRFFDRVNHREMIILEATSRELPDRDLNRAKHLKKAFDAGANIERL
ncbi:MAG: NAD(P)H-dependent oxidoreductase [Treponema sp.]|nr:NAD(P)H-dependent oxidoreductase [Treponema sp.]